MARSKDEEKEHVFISNYVKKNHPDVIFNCDLSGVNLHARQAALCKEMRSDRGFSDMTFYEPRGGYHGLFIELKRTGEVIYNKDGSLRKNKHLEEQRDMLVRLSKRLYYARFCIGQDEAIEVIENYLKL